MRNSNSWRGLFGFSIASALTMLALSSVFAGGPTGGSPLDPLMVPKDWQTIAPNATLWFYFDYAMNDGGVGGGGPGGLSGFRGGSRGHPSATVSVDANGASGIQFAVYTPDQAQDWLRDQKTTPIGRGTPYKNTASGDIAHDLFWWGSFNANGRYFVAITNNSPAPISYLLSVTGDSVTLYPIPTITPTPTFPLPFTVTPVPTGTIQGKLVFETATGGAIYTVNGDGSNLTLLTNGIDPTWSPDGKQIAFARWNATFPGLYVINVEGSKEQLIYQADHIRSPVWSPDGKYIAFTLEKIAQGGSKWKLGVVELNKRIDADTTKNVLTEPQCTNLCYVPSWENDSLTLTYTDPGVGIMTTSIISGSAQLLMGPTGTYFDQNKGVALPIEHLTQIQDSVISPDSKRIVYAQAAHDRWEINVVNADGSNPTGVTSPNAVLYSLWGVTYHNVAPTWSPDSQQILFLSNRNGKWEFFVTDPTGTNTRQVLKNVTDMVYLTFNYENERMVSWAK